MKKHIYTLVVVAIFVSCTTKYKATQTAAVAEPVKEIAKEPVIEKTQEAIVEKVTTVAEVAEPTTVLKFASESPIFNNALSKCQLQSSFISKSITKLDDYVSDFFYLNDNKLVMTNDNVKSRTELRNLTHFDKSENNTMYIKARLEATEGDKVTIAQVSNKFSGSNLFKIVIDGNKVNYRFYNNQDKTAKEDEEKGYFNSLINGDFELSININNNLITATINGESKTFAIGPKWTAENDGNYYFKTGVNSSKDGKCRITYSNLTFN
jgi:arginine repressor